MLELFDPSGRGRGEGRKEGEERSAPRLKQARRQWESLFYKAWQGLKSSSLQDSSLDSLSARGG